MAERPHAVVTGIGLVTPLGRGVTDFFEGLCLGRSGLRRPPKGHPLGGSVRVAGIAPNAAHADAPGVAEDGPTARCVRLALAAAADALCDARLVVGRDVDPARTAVVVSSGGAGPRTYDHPTAGAAPRHPSWLLPNPVAGRIAAVHGIRGVSPAVPTACASGAQSVAEALRIIRAGEADVVLCGGADAPLHPAVARGFADAGALATGWADPTAASRPFDLARNGFVLAEGAGILVVESREHANARGVLAYADLLGWGGSTNSAHPDPRGDGAVEAMRRALVDARVSPGDVGYLNAHGSGARIGDAAEATAIRAVFGAGPQVSSVKSVTGHMLAGAGAVEAAVTAIAIAAGELPPTHNLLDPDPVCALEHIRDKACRADVAVAVSNSFAFGGHNISLVLGRSQSRSERQRAATQARTAGAASTPPGHSTFGGRDQ